MNESKYHHGDLREALIESGINILKEEGIEKLTLRNIANACNVSHSAPHNHFKDKSNLIDEITERIAILFKENLEQVCDNNKNPEELLVQLGVAYIHFFITTPNYFKLLFLYNEKFSVRLETNGDLQSDFAPFIFFVNIAAIFLNDTNYESKFEFNKDIITMWAIVHGLTTIKISSSFNTDDDFLKLAKGIIKERFLIRPKDRNCS